MAEELVGKFKNLIRYATRLKTAFNKDLLRLSIRLDWLSQLLRGLVRQCHPRKEGYRCPWKSDKSSGGSRFYLYWLWATSRPAVLWTEIDRTSKIWVGLVSIKTLNYLAYSVLNPSPHAFMTLESELNE